MNSLNINKHSENKKLVLVGGCFDILHFGHINFLREAKKHGDYLVVALESDENVRRIKGDNRPIHTQTQRKEMLEALEFVDEVKMLPPMNTDDDYNNLVQEIKPTIIAITEGDPIVDKKQKQSDSIGAKLIIISKILTPSTSQLAKLLNLD